MLEGQLVIDLATLLGLRDNPCTLDGGVIPAPVARELARTVKWWPLGPRWASAASPVGEVTDPVTGHLLDYGSRTYLPGPLVRYTKARDGQCAAPYCQRPASRCQMDHRIPHPEGPSASWNCGAFCDRHHPLKTDGWISVVASDASGAITYRTLWGQEVQTEATPYLPDPRAPDPETENADTGPPGETPVEPGLDDEPPPF